MYVVSQHGGELREVLLYVGRQFRRLLEVRDVYSVHPLLVYLALHYLASELQHSHHVTKMRQHLQLQFVRTNNLAP